MKGRSTAQIWALARLFMTVLVLADAGCASAPKPDWNQRIGQYTFDDAVRELGPPASSTRLTDGSVVAEWFQKHGSQMSFGFGTGAFGPGGGVGVGQTVTTPPKAHFLRLTFGPDGKLLSHEKITR
ncbi:MAG: hypothetical protein C5B50_17770 [Verrucomicrobia bacterium]|nr:MAG: hypothetical protein C5B50_17770 [Verrucomicrobiota bacterium]